MWHVDANNENKFRGKETEFANPINQAVTNQKHAL